MMFGHIEEKSMVLGNFLAAIEKRGVTLEMLNLVNKEPSQLNFLADYIKRMAIKPFSCDDLLLRFLPYDRFFGPTDILRYTGFSIPEDKELMESVDFSNLISFMASPCPINPKKLLFESWYLFYLPRNIAVMDLRRMFSDTSQPRFRPYRSEAERERFENDCILNGEQSEHEWVLFYDGSDFCANKALQEQFNLSEKARWSGCLFPKPVESVAFHFFKFLKNGTKSNQNYQGRTGAYDGKDGTILHAEFLERVGQRYCVGKFTDDGIEIVVRDNFYRSRDLGLFLVIYPDVLNGGSNER